MQIINIHRIRNSVLTLDKNVKIVVIIFGESVPQTILGKKLSDLNLLLTN